MAVFTISRETGSEGDKLGMDLARSLGYIFLDKEIIRQVAEKVGTSPEAIERFDEKAEGRLVRFLTRLFRSHPEVVPYYGTFPQSEPAFAYGVSVPYLYYEMPGEGPKAPPAPEKVVEHFESIIKKCAEDGNAVIVGRASQIILQDTPGVYHIRTVAPLEWRIANFRKDNPDLDEEDAADLVERNDCWRRNYICAYYDRDWRDESLYHAVISMDKWDRGELAGMLRSLAESASAP